MKISSSIGVTGGQQTTMAATFAEVVAGLGYNYTWAADFSGLDVSDFPLPTGGNAFDTVSYPANGIRVAADRSSSVSFSQYLEVNQANLRDSAHSGPTGDFPDEMMPDINDGSPTGNSPNDLARAIGHPGRYVTVVATFNKYDITSGTVHQGMVIYDQNGQQIFFLKNAPFGAGSTIINGSVATLSTQAEYDSIVGANPTLITFDMNDSEIKVSSELTDDGQSFRLYAAYAKQVDFDITYHGIIHSDVPPTLPSTPTDFLPIEISDPSIT